jgi:citrate lyase subunit beta/citryl-CoA lyase
MAKTDLRTCRTLLFLPASNPRAIEKARSLPADLIILDLEDSVREEDKVEGRRLALETGKETFGGRPVAIRVNQTGSRHFGQDITTVRHTDVDYVVLSKAESQKDVHDAVGLMSRPVLAMIETPRAIVDAAAIATLSAGLIAGTNDLSATLGLPEQKAREGLVYALQRVVLAARAAGIPAFDGVYNRLEADAGLEAECRQGRSWGFDGKSVIHPSQIDTANRLFGPTEEELEAARRLIAAATGGAERHEGKMVEAMHVEMAHRLIAKARR